MPEGCRTWETVGKGRSGREEGNDIFRRGRMRGVAGVRLACEASARGEETTGRENVTVAKRSEYYYGNPK